MRRRTAIRRLCLLCTLTVAGCLLVVLTKISADDEDANWLTEEALEDAAQCRLASPGPDGYSMRDLLLSWPPNKPRGFIYVVVNPFETDASIKVIQSVYEHFNRHHDYPIIAFSESPAARVVIAQCIDACCLISDASRATGSTTARSTNPQLGLIVWTTSEIATLMRKSLSRLGDVAHSIGRVFAYDISRFWQLPAHLLQKHDNSEMLLSAFAYRSIAETGCQFPANLGYWLMCRFQSKGITEIAFVRSFEYLWRLDVDSTLCGPLSFDIFSHMKDNDYWQGYLAEDTWDSCAERLTEAVHSYIQTYAVTPVQGNDSIKDARTWYIYNNFEIFKVKFYQKKEYRQYINFIDRTGGFFYYRWGDAPVRTQASRLHMPKEKMRVFKVGEVFYQHQGFDRCPARAAVAVT